MTITVANFITQYLRTSLPSAADWSDATLGYWIDAALLDISRSFPRKANAQWAALTGMHTYAYADSLTVADETTIIRLLNCIYPFDGTNVNGPRMVFKSHLDEDFIGGPYYEPDNDAQILYLGPAFIAAAKIYSDAHLYWKIDTATIINPSEHLDLIRLFCIWQAYLHQLTDIMSSSVPDGTLLNAVALETTRAEKTYHDAYQKLAEAKATSIYTDGWILDKWDRNTGNPSSNIGQN